MLVSWLLKQTHDMLRSFWLHQIMRHEQIMQMNTRAYRSYVICRQIRSVWLEQVLHNSTNILERLKDEGSLYCNTKTKEKRLWGHLCRITNRLHVQGWRFNIPFCRASHSPSINTLQPRDILGSNARDGLLSTRPSVPAYRWILFSNKEDTHLKAAAMHSYSAPSSWGV